MKVDLSLDLRQRCALQEEAVKRGLTLKKYLEGIIKEHSDFLVKRKNLRADQVIRQAWGPGG